MVEPELVLVLPNQEFGREVWVLEERVGKECLGWGIGVTTASCSVTLGIGHEQERWGSNV